MQIQNFLITMIEAGGVALAVVLIPMLTAEIRKWLSNKTESDKLEQCIGELEYVTKKAVLTTTQTFVHELKAQGKFDKDAQIAAFNMARDALLKMLSEEAYEVLKRNVADIDVYISNMIESAVYEDKQNAAQ